MSLIGQQIDRGKNAGIWDIKDLCYGFYYLVRQSDGLGRMEKVSDVEREVADATELEKRKKTGNFPCLDFFAENGILASLQLNDKYSSLNIITHAVPSGLNGGTAWYCYLQEESYSPYYANKLNTHNFSLKYNKSYHQCHLFEKKEDKWIIHPNGLGHTETNVTEKRMEELIQEFKKHYLDKFLAKLGPENLWINKDKFGNDLFVFSLKGIEMKKDYRDEVHFILTAGNIAWNRYRLNGKTCTVPKTKRATTKEVILELVETELDKYLQNYIALTKKR